MTDRGHINIHGGVLRVLPYIAAALAIFAILIAAIIYLSIELRAAQRQQDSFNKARIESLGKVRQDAEKRIKTATDSIATLEELLDQNALTITNTNTKRNEKPKTIILRGDTSAILRELQRISAEVGQD